MGNSLLSPTFVIGYIQIGSVEGASCINLGNNYPSGFQSHKKQNQGFGTVHGDGNSLREIRSVLEDNDVLDVLEQSDARVAETVKSSLLASASVTAS
ncbi:hypothetical protein [Paenibacillus hamazuiensis]|uniref:hypothetical protein n=1 Tax=Paenibacillus hamazuiensis TaxID=2936508 RepID=UPI00200DAE7D|nr:hypothetical protein [Paenibacillus hamazuiensis]